MEKQFKRVGTHSGRFHADEVMSTVILQQVFDTEVVRSRETEVLNQLDLIYDVGEGEFDHHQAEKRYRESGTPYAACGLIWNSFGRNVLKAADQGLKEDEVEYLFKSIDGGLIEGIDAVDNGVKTTVRIIPTMNLSSLISEFNPPWDSQVSEDDAFHSAVDFAANVFKNTLRHQMSVVKAKSRVQEAYNNRQRPELLVLDRSYPWNRILNDIDANNEVLFVIYPRDSQYIIQTVRNNNGKYGDRKRLPRSWAGKRDAELFKITGVEDAVFCHTARFIASAKSFEGIMNLAQLALAEPEPKAQKTFFELLKKFLLSQKGKIRR